MKMKQIIAVTAILAGILCAAAGLLIPCLIAQTATGPSVGIIGGADMPTYRFLLIQFRPYLNLVILGIVLMAAGIALLLIRKRK